MAGVVSLLAKYFETNVARPCGPLLSMATAALVGCDNPSERRAASSLDEDAGSKPLGKTQACSRCHLFPEPRSLPRHAWKQVIDEMAMIAEKSTQGSLHLEDIAEAREFFSRESPLSLTVDDEESSHVDESQDWSATHFTPPGLEQTLLPAVANVTVARLGEGEPPSLLVAEMRSRALLHLPMVVPDGVPRILYPALRELNYPAGLAVTDLDEDGLADLVLTGMGSMQPTNAEEGTIIFARQEPGRRFRKQVVAEGLGRPVAVRTADLDGDGDIDTVYAAFGLRDPGQLVILENRSRSNRRLDVAEHMLDGRDGFASIEIADMDSDGQLDIVALLAQEHEQVIVFRNQGALEFEPHLVWAAPHPSWAFSHLQVADLNGDGAPDIVTSNGDSLDYNVVKPYTGVQCFENQRNLQFRRFSIGRLPGCSSSASADVDGDGDLDVVATAFMPLSRPGQWIKNNLTSIVWFENPGAHERGSWNGHIVEKHSASHPTIAVVQVNGVQKTQIAVGNYVWIDRDRGPLHRSPYITVYSRD